MLTRDDLHNYQDNAVAFILEKPYCMAALEMGLGKSVSTGTAISDLFDSVEVSRVLIVAPKRVALKTWPGELQSWQHLQHLTFTQLTGLAPKSRATAAAQQTDIHIINRENLVWLVEFWGKKWPYDMVVIDESDGFKNRSSKRWKAIKKMRKYISRMVLLTGTPAPNGLLDLWAQIFLLDGGARLDTSVTRYKTKYFDSDWMGWNWTLKPGAEERIHAKISDICLSMSAEDYLEVPECVHNTVLVELPHPARTRYRELEKEFVSYMDGEEVVAVNAAALANKLLQCACGSVYSEDGVVELHNEKLNALEEIVESNPGQNLLVAHSYTSDMERILKKFPQAEVLDEAESIDRWNAGEIEMLVCHPASAGHGLNLQRGGHIMVWYGLPWSLGLYQQMNARLHRQGQTERTFIHHIVAGDTVDEVVMAALERKDATQKKLLAALKASIE